MISILESLIESIHQQFDPCSNRGFYGGYDHTLTVGHTLQAVGLTQSQYPWF